MVEEVDTSGLLRRRVALKRPTATALQRERDRRRFQREVRLLERLDHPNIVSILDLELDDDDLWFTIPLAETTLARKMLHSSGLDDDEIASVFDQVLAAIAHAHSRV